MTSIRLCHFLFDPLHFLFYQPINFLFLKTSNGERSVVKLLIEIGFLKMKRRSLQIQSILFSQLKKGTKTTRQNENVILDVQQI